jgi:hypothetical protein
MTNHTKRVDWDAALEHKPLDITAAEKLGELHDELKASGYTGHPLERCLIRILFCLFAENTDIFETGSFTKIVRQTQEDGSDLGPALNRLFEVLDTPNERRQTSLSPALAHFRCINGGLFEERLPIAAFDGRMRHILLDCAKIEWSQISPAICGSLFQTVMEDPERRLTGSHYTPEDDILRVIKPLFLDDHWATFERLKKNKRELTKFHERLASMRFLDPACGCGNFLVITYREIRKLELAILKEIYGNRVLNIEQICLVNVDQMFGIELQEWPVRIAELALWLTDHLMNQQVAKEFGGYFQRLPLKKAATIVQGNALQLDWGVIIAPSECSYILGNPPFYGGKQQSIEQKTDLKLAADGCPNVGLLDYVCGWYFKAARFIQGTAIKVGFVSTNSITQGEQVGVLWEELLNRYHIKLHFAYRSFPWGGEARGKAHVHVVILGFAATEPATRRLFDYGPKGEFLGETNAKNISPYLTDGPNTIIKNRSTAICQVPEMGIGNKPIDKGFYLFTDEEKSAFITKEPAAAALFHKWVGSDEFINGLSRWCLWVGDCSLQHLQQMPLVLERIEEVRKSRANSPSPGTRKLADRPTRFHVENFPKTTFLVVPEVSSERRPYIPVGFMSPDVICSNTVKILPEATLYHFGILSSTMHMSWVRTVGGRLETRYRYSVHLLYNNFPWPDSFAEDQRAVETTAQLVLTLRNAFTQKGLTLADLYDPLTMPVELVEAHRELDRAVDGCYRREPFGTERERVEFLFERYEALLSAKAVTTSNLDLFSEE